ncbi:MAG: hypothetical protein HGB12_16390 [Bacteroidetes bacterium]|nr:hypothetical protein [Bacteroidota bacterium]
MKPKNILIILVVCLLPLSSCVFSKSSEKKQNKIQARKEKKDAEVLVLYQKAISNHQKHQSKDTRKRMKRSLKKSQNPNKTTKVFFLKRWFSKK